jgi:ABC-type transporter Mla subunit MlaD
MMRLPFAFSPEQNMPAKSPTTLRMVYELVQSIDARTSRLEGTTGDLVTTSDRLVATTDSLVSRTNRLVEITDGLVATTNRLERNYDRIDATLLVMKDRMSDLEQRVASIEVRLEVVTRSVLTDEYHSISAQLKRLEARFDRMEADRLGRRVSVLENKVSELENSGRN